MYAIFYSKIVEQVNVVRKYAPIPTDNFSTKLARPNMFKMQNKPAMWVLAFFNVVVAISSKLALSFNEHFSTCQNNRALSATLSFHLRLDPSFWRSWLQKHIWFQTSTRIHQTHRFRKKKHSGEWFQKYAVSMSGLTGFVWTEGRFLQKTIRIR